MEGVPRQTASPQETKPSLVLTTRVYVTEVRLTWLESSFLGHSTWPRIPLSSGTGKNEKADSSHLLMVTFPASVSLSPVPSVTAGHLLEWCPLACAWFPSCHYCSFLLHLCARLSFGILGIARARGSRTLDCPGHLVSHWLLPGKGPVQAVPAASPYSLCVAAV